MSAEPFTITIRPTWRPCRMHLRGDVLYVSRWPLLVGAYWTLLKLRWWHWRGLIED